MSDVKQLQTELDSVKAQLERVSESGKTVLVKEGSWLDGETIDIEDTGFLFSDFQKCLFECSFGCYRQHLHRYRGDIPHRLK